MDLVFKRPAYTGGPIDIVFGGSGGGSGTGFPLFASGSSALGNLLGSGVAVYDNRNPLRVSAGTTQRHQPATSAGLEISMPTQPPTRRLGGTTQPLQRAQAAEGTPRQPIGTQGRVSGDSAQVHQVAALRWTGPAQVHQALAHVRAQAAQAHQVALALQVLAAQLHQAGTLTHTRAAEPLQQAQALRALAAQIGGAARFINFTHVQPFQAARPVPPGKEVWPPIDGGGGFEPYVPDLNLVFACPPYVPGAPIGLVFGHVCLPPVVPGASLFILPARFYMAVHSLQAWRLPDMLPVPVLEFSYQAERGSFGWSFGLSVRRSAFDDLAPVSGVPARLRVEADGIRFDMVVDGLRHDEAHGQRAVKVPGRSLTAILASPYAAQSQRLNATPFTAQQLALQALDLTGYTLDWDLTDWLVPAGAWSHSGTPLAAVQAIVEAAGGYLQSHRYLPELQARHPYPDLTGGVLGGPWNWGSVAVVPDVELAPDALITTGIERVDGPDLNAVYVSGVNQGVSGLYRRAGSAGDKLPSPLTDPLITAIEAVRQRGRAVIGAAGPKQRITATLPVLTGPSQPGILNVGQLIQVNAAQPWRGMVRGVSGSVAFGREVRQTLEIERHLGA